ncbi:MAG: aspartate aminotransferase family protein [Cytophagales bacterium]|nr:aspartate aminotransferase family protein [Cytophagales bacterium]MDW8384983.1 aspartate aminotransferase family protein [Flammeovirgaceae bacterium]
MSQRQIFLQHQAQTSDFPLMLEIESAKGIYLYQPDGKKIIDLISGISVSNVGHSHPKVVKAVQKQVKRHMHLMVYGELIQSPQTALAHALVQTLPTSLDNVFFVNSGSEAIEGAMKLAKRYTGRTEIVSCFRAYHGSTHGALSIGGGEYFKRNFRPLLPDIRQIYFGVEAELEKITEKTACFIVETVQGEAGVRTACSRYWKAVRQRCNETGALLILDEIQCGFGRTGKFWAFEHYGIVPDIVVTAKAMGGGMPLGAFIASKEIMSVLKNNPILGHITTFGGHPVSCAASLASLRIIQEKKLLSEVAHKAELFKQLLHHSTIREVRNAGLMIAVEFDNFEILQKIIQKALQLGVLTDWFLYCDNSMRIAPPLIITKKQIQKACDRILKAIQLAT